MNDTSPEIAEKVREMFQKKTPLERFEMGCAMYDMSRYLITQAILRDNPQISAVDLRKEIFLKFYGNDFGPVEKEKILSHLEQWAKKNSFL